MKGFTNVTHHATPPQVFSHPLALSERVLDLLSVGVYICDRDGFIVYYNRCAAELWGRAPKLRDFAERFCGSARLYRLDGGPIDCGNCLMAEVLSTGGPVRSQDVVMERPDGSRIAVRVDIDAIRDESGAIAGAISCFRDIKDERHLQNKARQAERQCHDILDALPAAISTTDADGRITFYNKAAADLWGCRPELGKSEFCGSWKLFSADGAPMAHDS